MAQAVLGGIVVLTDLNPAAVSLHFLLSSAILALAVTLYVRCAEGDAKPTRLVRREVRVFAVATVGVTALMLAAGTVVTGTGPLAGSTFVPRAGGGPAYVPRYHLPLEGVTQLHADIGWMLGTLAAALAVSLQLTGAPARARRLGWALLGLVGLQGVIGYSQYFSGPAGRPGLGARGRLGADLDRRPAADVRHPGPRPGGRSAAVPGALAEPVPAES